MCFVNKIIFCEDLMRIFLPCSGKRRFLTDINKHSLQHIIYFYHICYMDQGENIKSLIHGVNHGDRRALAKAITLIESNRPEDQEIKSMLMKAARSLGKAAVKIGITGSPGVGKSTFLNGFVRMFGESSSRIAILTIDPSSTLTGGSILGDKLRMTDIADMEQVFIRPSPSKGTLGGINLTTWETVLLCEAAGYDYIFIETVGVGQSEIEIQYLVNEVWYLTMARAGDEIQGIKRGILEIVDRVIVTKEDLNPREAQNTAAFLRQSLKIIQTRPKKASFYTLTPLQQDTMKTLFEDLQTVQPHPLEKDQLTFWFSRGWRETILRKIQSHPRIQVLYERMLSDVHGNASDYWSAMDHLVNEIDDLWKE